MQSIRFDASFTERCWAMSAELVYDDVCNQTLIVHSRSQNGSFNIVCKYEKYFAFSIFKNNTRHVK